MIFPGGSEECREKHGLTPNRQEKVKDAVKRKKNGNSGNVLRSRRQRETRLA